jgi:anion-transporting  ArsA/GET3 family ATPase
LHIVSGKGGTGKSTIAGALACALAAGDRHVLLCEVEGREQISHLFGGGTLEGGGERHILTTPDGGDIYGLAVDPQHTLLEYLETYYHLGLAGRALERFGVIDFATSVAPGLQDLLVLGKVYEVARRLIKNRPRAYDAVVLDAPPTGRIAKFLNVGEAVSDLAKVGPIRGQADSINAVLHSEHTCVHLVSLLEEMPVTETVEASSGLQDIDIALGTVIANKIIPPLLDTAALRSAASELLPVEVPGLSEADNKALAAEFSTDAQRMLGEDEQRARLAQLHTPMAEIGNDPAGIDTGAIFAIARSLTGQLSDEVRR